MLDKKRALRCIFLFDKKDATPITQAGFMINRLSINTKNPSYFYEGFLKKATTYSPTIVVPSAQMGLTSLFGKVRGEPHRYNHLKF